MPRSARPATARSPRAARRRDGRATGGASLGWDELRRRITTSGAAGDPTRTERARRLLTAWLDTAMRSGMTPERAVADLASGAAARQLGEATRAAIMRDPPPVVTNAACAQGCAFCCILHDADRAAITENEARRLHAALAPRADEPDGRKWHPSACSSLDPETRACRAYDARPSLCRSYVSASAEACERNAGGGSEAGGGLLGSHLDYLDVHALARAALKGVAQVRTYSLPRVAAAAVEGQDEAAALAAGRQRPPTLDTVRTEIAAAAGR